MWADSQRPASPEEGETGPNSATPEPQGASTGSAARVSEAAPPQERPAHGGHGNGGDGNGSDENGEAALQAVEEDLDELTRLTLERDEYLKLAQRTQADFENFRRRKAKEAETAQERGVARLAKELLPALDNLQRAIDAADQEDPLLEGVRLVQTDIAGALARLGIESFSPDGEVFDPVEHEAVAQTPIEGAQSGTVVEVYQVGYRAGETILRPARVVVAA
jgi:molecular chaperone GrpE